MSASIEIDCNCSATMNLTWSDETTIGFAKIGDLDTLSAVFWNVECSPIKLINCFGKLSRDAGQRRVPDPPERITGTIVGLARLSAFTAASPWRGIFGSRGRTCWVDL